MFELYADKTNLTVRKKERVTSGSVNVYPVRFEFSPDWDGLDKVAVFRAGGKTVSVLLGEDGGETTIPWEVLADAGCVLYGGVYGTRGSETVLPTIWAEMAVIERGAAPGQEARPPTPDLWEQELAKKGDGLSYDGLRLSLKSGDKTISTVEIAGGGGGTSDHRALTNRDAEEQHPIEAISGLSDRLGKTMTTDNVLSVSEILKIMEVT